MEREQEASLRLSLAGQKAIVELATHPAVAEGELEDAARAITEAAAGVLSTERVSVWLLNEDATELRCVDLFERSGRSHSSGTVLKAADYPAYFAALREGRAIAADEARTDPRTREFTEGYLEPLGITSMLDGAIRLRGEVVGVVCHEQIGQPRHWLPEETSFAGEIADQVAQTLQNADRRRSAQLLRESEERLRLMAQATRDAIWDVDLVNNLVWFNDAYREMAGPRPSDVESSWQWWASRIREDERQGVVDSLQRAITDPAQQHWQADYHFLSHEEGERFVQDRAHITRDESGRAIRVVGSMRDQTELERALEEREEMERKFQETQKLESLGVLAGGIAHDFNNLLTAMIGNVSLLKLELPDRSDCQEMLDEVESAAMRAADLCKQMLAYSGQGRFVLGRLDLSGVVREIVPLLEVSISKSARLHLRLAEDLPPVLADAAQMNQVVMNLVINASEAIGSASGLISLTTGALQARADYLSGLGMDRELEPGCYVFLEVSDDGAGMDEETMARIFEPFFTTKFTGRGLGLAAVQGIVRGHKGGLKVYSEPGKGTTFKILLPAAEQTGEAADPECVPSRAEAAEDSVILVVDDEPTVRATAERVLGRFGHRVVLAEDGAQGVELLRSRRGEIAAVLLDLTMPHMDGVEAFRQMRQVKPGIPVVLMSGYNEEAALQRFMGKGLSGFIQKPFLAEALARKVDEVLRTRDQAE